MNLIESTLKYDGFLKVFTNTYQTGTQKIVREVLERGDAVAALVYNLDDELYYLVSQPRPATFNKVVDAENFVEVIAGMIDKDEIGWEAIVREITEELGFKEFVDVIFLKVFFPSPGGCSEKVYLYYVEVTNEGKIETNGVGDENIRTVTFTKEELLQKEFFDAKTIIAIQSLNHVK